MDHIMRHIMLTSLAAALLGCGMSPPEHYSISAEFSEPERVTSFARGEVAQGLD
jgi:hypothetical protein